MLAHPQAQWRDHLLVMNRFNYPELIPINDKLLRALVGQAARLGVQSAEDWSDLGFRIHATSKRDLFRTTAMDCYETALTLAATNATGRFEFQRDTAERLVLLLQSDVKGRNWATNALPQESFTRDHQRVRTALDQLQRAYPENSSQTVTFGRLRQELNYSLAFDIVGVIDYARLTRNQMGDVIGYLSHLKSGAATNQAARFNELIADVQMRRVGGLTKRTAASVLDDDEAELRYKLACADAPKDRLSYYESLYKSYLDHAGKLKAAGTANRLERAVQKPAADEWVTDFGDPRLMSKPAPTAAPPSGGGNPSDSVAPAKSTGRYCMSCSGTGSRTVWEDAYDSYSRQWGRKQVTKNCDRCGGRGTLP